MDLNHFMEKHVKGYTLGQGSRALRGTDVPGRLSSRLLFLRRTYPKEQWPLVRQDEKSTEVPDKMNGNNYIFQ